MMRIHLVFVTYNRLEYTKRALPSVLADPTERFDLTIWDNASTDGTAEYLRDQIDDPRIVDLVLSRENIGQTAAVNRIWADSKADLLGKLDNDCIVTPGWTRTLAEAHRDIPNLGVVACWHFLPEDFDYERAKHKIQTFGRHQIFRHPWTCGTGLLIKRETFKRFGPMQQTATTRYWLEMALAGYINGFYYPLIHQEHMDDPMSPHCLIRDAESFARYRKITFGLGSGRYQDVEGRRKTRNGMVANLLDEPFDPRYYVGWRARKRRLQRRLTQSWERVRARRQQGAPG